MVGKVTWKPLALPLLTKAVNLSNIVFLEGLQRLSAITEALKDEGVVIPTTSPFNSPLYTRHVSGRVTVGSHELSQMAVPIAAAVPDVALLLKQINRFLGTQYAAADLENAFFSIPVNQDYLGQFAFDEQGQQSTSLSYLRDILTLIQSSGTLITPPFCRTSHWFIKLVTG